MILPKNQIKQFAQMKEAFQNADNSSDNEKQKNVSEEPVGAEILRKHRCAEANAAKEKLE